MVKLSNSECVHWSGRSVVMMCSYIHCGQCLKLSLRVVSNLVRLLPQLNQTTTSVSSWPCFLPTHVPSYCCIMPLVPPQSLLCAQPAGQSFMFPAHCCIRSIDFYPASLHLQPPAQCTDSDRANWSPLSPSTHCQNTTQHTGSHSTLTMFIFTHPVPEGIHYTNTCHYWCHNYQAYVTHLL